MKEVSLKLLYTVIMLTFPLCGYASSAGDSPIDTLIKDPSYPDDPVVPPGHDILTGTDSLFYFLNPERPPVPSVSNSQSVGTIEGTFRVTELGGAEYSIAFKCPPSSLSPQAGLIYNSQNAAYGSAGYGFNISGLSSISRGEKNIFNNNGLVKGLTYTNEDYLFLDGKRLIIISGTPGHEGATYCLEGDPYTKIYQHGTYDEDGSQTWFEVKTADGKTLEYGKTQDAAIRYANKKGQSHIGSWYMNRMEDVYGNYVEYTYEVSNLFAYPATITYGMNKKKDCGIVNRIDFFYEPLGAAEAIFNLEDRKGKIDRRLSEVRSSCNGSVFRKYRFTYDAESDGNPNPFSRLISVQEENSKGETLPPTTFIWNFLPASGLQSSKINTYSTKVQDHCEETFKSYLAADLTGDGVSDFMRLSQIKSPDGPNFNLTTCLFISKSKVSDDGSVSYNDTLPLIYALPPSLSLVDMSWNFGTSSIMDFDGDGLNDFVILFSDVTGDRSIINFYIITGQQVVADKKGSYVQIVAPLKNAKKLPLYATSDFDKNGKDDFVVIEREASQGMYHGHIVKKREYEDSVDGYEFALDLPSEPKRLFSGDFNNDGLTDIILLYDGGYKIYFNKGGGLNDTHFSESDSKKGSSFGDCWRVEQGDFDGDGLPDFVRFVKGETLLRIERNNGDGTFTCIKSDDTGLDDHATSLDDGRFAIKVVDLDHDGRSDVMMCKACYVHRGFPEFENEYTSTQVRWLYSDGTTLRLKESATKWREADAEERYFITGDFDGDGNLEIANYGSNLLAESDNSVPDNYISVYRPGGSSMASGRITGITDGMGNSFSIEYASGTNPEVYTRTLKKICPNVNTYTLPIALVRKVTSSNGIAGNQTTLYSYKDFGLHMKGAGPLGFSETSRTNTTTGESVFSSVTKWDENHLVPVEIKAVNRVGDKSSTSVSRRTVENVQGTYFAFESHVSLSDVDGFQTTTISNYDTAKGVILDRTVCNDTYEIALTKIGQANTMYKKVAYSDYVLKAGMWMPTVMTTTQKHSQATSASTDVTHYEYDDLGNLLSTTVHSGTVMALTTTATYDEFGNRLSSTKTGNNIITVTEYNEYDPSGRFVVRRYSVPASSVKTFDYDLWGNLLSENDVTNPSDILTTTYNYDSWGRRISTITPDGLKSEIETGWGNNDRNKYYVLAKSTKRPWKMTWFDKAGHETSTLSFGLDKTTLYSRTDYNGKGLVEKVFRQNGQLSSSQSFTYDDMGRKLSDKLSTGKETTYSYGRRSVSVTSAGKTSTSTYDAWGNILTSTDPIGNTVSYTYNSDGLPASVTSAGSTVSMLYDVAGNRISLNDPDAGCSNAIYSPDGRILEQKDARGVTTLYSYDNLGRIQSVKCGSHILTNTYGTSGNARMRLTKQTMGGNSVEYAYDRLGRTIGEKRSVTGQGSYFYSYIYDDYGRLATSILPGGLIVNYIYDDYGFRTGIIADGKPVCKFEEYDGRSRTTTFMDSISFTLDLDEQGFEHRRRITRGGGTLDDISMSFDHATGNLRARQRGYGKMEDFVYDDLDRLTAVDHSNAIMFNPVVPRKIIAELKRDRIMDIAYSPDGNILSKTGLGNYSYDPSFKPHAVLSVEDSASVIPTAALITEFNDFGKIDHIADESSGLSMDFSYGPDMQRWYSLMRKDGRDSVATIYAGAYEKVTVGSRVREYYYLDGGVIVIGENGSFRPCVAFTDHQGSVLSVFSSEGNKLFSASYDPWGVQTVDVDSIGLRRGYTGHEMLPEFGIINMNGRLYDPLLGRFLSPDSHIQFPDFSQSFNRYSYCLNNPLKYTDPSGESITAVIGFGIFNLFTSMLNASAAGKNIWTAGLSSLISSAASFGIGQLFGNLGSISHEFLRAGAHGLASSVVSMISGGNIVGSLVSGAVSSGLGSIAQGVKLDGSLMIAASATAGGLTALACGNDFLSGAMQGLKIAFLNDAQHLTSESYYDENGEKHIDFKVGVECVAKRVIISPEVDCTVGSASVFNSLIGIADFSFENNDKMTFAYKCNQITGSKKYQVYPDKYIKPAAVSKVIAEYAAKASKIGLLFYGYRLSGAIKADTHTYQNEKQISISNTSEAVLEMTAEYVGTAIGIKYGAIAGSFFVGIGFLPGPVVGGCIGGCIGGYIGSHINLW